MEPQLPLPLGDPPSRPGGVRAGPGCRLRRGVLARELRRVVRHVAAIDRDPASVDRAQSQDASSDIEYLLGEFLTYRSSPRRST